MRILTALAAIADIKDFRLGNLMRSLGLDPSQPVLLYRLLIKEARDVVKLIGEVKQLRGSVAHLQSELSTAKNQRDAELSDARQELESWRQRATTAQQDAEAVRRQIDQLSVQLTEARSDAIFAGTLVRCLVAFLAGDNSREVLERIRHLASLMCLEARLQSMRGDEGIPRDDPNFARVRSFLQHQLRLSLALSPEEYLFAWLCTSIWTTECADCGRSGARADERIVWAHMDCQTKDRKPVSPLQAAIVSAFGPPTS